MKKPIIFFIITTLSLSSFAQAPVSADEQQIRANITTMEQGWNTKDGKLFASVFAEVHDFVVWDGLYFPNSTRQQCSMAHQGLFDGVYKTRNLQLKVDKVKFLKPDLALIHVMGGTYQIGTSLPADPEVLMSIIMQKTNGAWQIISFHNLDLLTITDPEHGKRSPMPLRVMYAGWYNQP